MWGVLSTEPLLFSTAFLGLALHGFFCVGLVYMSSSRRDAVRFFATLACPLSTAYVTSSSGVALPVALRLLEQDGYVERGPLRVLLPALLVVLRAGTSVYNMVALLFVAQRRHRDISLGARVAMCAANALSSLGIGSMPGGTSFGTTFLLRLAGLPPQDVDCVAALEVLLDRFASMHNLLACCTCCVFLGSGPSSYTRQR
ncbi:excitatory amino acid transporter 3-like isoform X1 [Ixodes scapularis]|uniref:excitatory amino acid transporter 3-like isoform X1 n=1 Tax=Ixodes scapularis TaxID=6945 RepID=UPI001C3937E7|nr:excitatory amino acid transporter 3-like isoform X1 [Ixodes scapularis]